MASVLMKFGMKNFNLDNNNFMGAIRYALVNPMVLIGLVSFGLSFISYSIVLSKIKLSIAYPILTSGGFIIVVIFSVFFFKESITLVQFLGFLFIVLGVWLVSTAMR